MTTLACIAGGRLFLVDSGEEPRQLESPYAEQVRARERQLQRKNAWKTQGTGARFMGGGRAMLWGESTEELPPARFVGVTRGRDASELFYAISTGVVAGIFGRSTASSDEQRIFHDAETALGDVCFSPVHEAFVFSMQGKAGSSSIGILADDGRGVRTLTEGDVVDRAPRWIPGEERAIVYASSGIGRTNAGHYAGTSAFAVHRLSIERGEIDVVAADPKFDFLAPVAVSERELYAIRRPYRHPYDPVSLGRTLLDAISMPFRLVFALFQYLNFFTARYTGKPLLTSGNARQKAADARQMMIWGNLVDVSEQADREASEEASLKSRGYELVRITPHGIEALARGVIAFDVAKDGSVYYSTGSKVARLADGKAHPLVDIERVEQLCVCE